MLTVRSGQRLDGSDEGYVCLTLLSVGETENAAHSCEIAASQLPHKSGARVGEDNYEWAIRGGRTSPGDSWRETLHGLRKEGGAADGEA